MIIPNLDDHKNDDANDNNRKKEKHNRTCRLNGRSLKWRRSKHNCYEICNQGLPSTFLAELWSNDKFFHRYNRLIKDYHGK